MTIQGLNLWGLKEKLRQHPAARIAEQGSDPIFILAIRVEQSVKEPSQNRELEDA